MPDLPANTVLADALLEDLRYVVRHGPREIDPESVPVLAELAEGITPSDDYSEAVESLLHAGIARLPRPPGEAEDLA